MGLVRTWIEFDGFFSLSILCYSISFVDFPFVFVFWLLLFLFFAFHSDNDAFTDGFVPYISFSQKTNFQWKQIALNRNEMFWTTQHLKTESLTLSGERVRFLWVRRAAWERKDNEKTKLYFHCIWFIDILFVSRVLIALIIK